MGTYVSADEYAEMMHLHPYAVRRMCARGDLGAIKCGSRWRIPVDGPHDVGETQRGDPAMREAIVSYLDSMAESIAGLRAALLKMGGEQ